MHWIDLSIFILYMCLLIGIGIYFMRRNKNADDYFVGGRNMSSLHVGLSVVATDVGGGFSIGLGGLGFVMGLSGSWMLFTGLIGAWLSAVFLIPKVSKLENFKELYTFPQIFARLYNKRVAFTAGIISAIGYIGFTASQILAGAKLASASFVSLNMDTALLIMGIIVVVYTFLGGMKAVIYTDTVQWLGLMAGLIFIGIPLGYIAVGGYDSIRATVDPEMFSFTNLTWQQAVKWSVTIIPIWFVGMTLYQRIFSCHDKKTAQRAWYIAGFFEYPVMAFMGVLLGLFSRVAADQGMFAYLGYDAIHQLDPEMGLPMLLRTVLPVGLMGLMMSAYFSAIMSTADSCLIAASGNLVTDIIGRFVNFGSSHKRILLLSQFMTLILGIFALFLASNMQNVLELMLYSYAFMVSGLFVPVIGAFYWKKSSATAALWAMLIGGGTTITLIIAHPTLPFGLDPNIFGITASALIFIIFSHIFPSREAKPNIPLNGLAKA